MWETVLSSHHMGLRDGLRSPLRRVLFHVSCLAQSPTLLQRQGLGPGLSPAHCAAGHILPGSFPPPAGVPCHRRETRVEFPGSASTRVLGFAVGCRSPAPQMSIFISSIRMACMGCTRMYITSTLSTRYRAYRCCSAGPECAQVRCGRGGAGVWPLSDPSQPKLEV